MRCWARSARLVSATVATGLLAMSSACSTEEGRAVAGSQNTPSSPPPASLAPQSSDGRGSPEGQLDKAVACELLTTEEVNQLDKNYKSFEIVDQGSVSPNSDTCTRQSKSSDSSEGSVVVGIAIWSKLTIDNYKTTPNDQVVDGQVGGRPAKQIKDDSGECVVTFAAEQGRVDVVVEADSVERACEIADRAAEVVEPKTPEPAN